MSYCRFSSDDFQSDVYCYANIYGGWSIHVANNRLIFSGPLPDPLDTDCDDDEWIKRDLVITELVRQAKRMDIGGPHDGGYFYEPTALAAIERLQALRDVGYRVPQTALDRLITECKEED